MKETVKKVQTTLVTVKNHLNTHKATYAAAAVAVAAIALQQKNRRDFNEFLTGRGIDLDEYYLPEYYAEKTALKEALINEIKNNA